MTLPRWCPLLLAILVPSTANAYTLIEKDALAISVGGWAQAGYLVSDPGGEADFEYETYLGLARLAGLVAYRPWGSAFVQIEGISGGVTLLDVVAEVTPTDALAIRVGQFRTPTSVDLMVAAPFTPFVNRSVIVQRGFVQSRLIGLEVEGTLKRDSWSGALRLAVFNPSAAARGLFPDGDGQFFSARALVGLSSGIHFHLAYIGLISGDNAPFTMGSAIRPVPFDDVIDAAIYYIKDGWNFTIEGVVVADAPTDNTPFAAYVHLLRSYDVGFADFKLEPGARYEIFKPDDDVLHRVTLGLNLYFVGDFLNTSLNYEATIQPDQTGHTGYLQLQAGF